MIPKRNKFMDIMGLIVLVLSFTYFFIVYFFKNVDSESNFTTQIVTAVIAMDMLVLGYYFGSSNNSATKDATIQSMAQTQQNQPQVTVTKAEDVTTKNVGIVNTNTTTVKNEDGVTWSGDLDIEPVNPIKNQAYFNTTVGKGFIYNGIYWKELSQAEVDNIKTGR